ncbi:CrcB family protein [Brevibacterium samyangense]|uniref:Fluoride-specific ion channel n=1 Tax=Brevibacterium samyangense TaxID=366888 RepID=A0ABP5EV49_9MICO
MSATPNAPVRPRVRRTTGTGSQVHWALGALVVLAGGLIGTWARWATVLALPTEFAAAPLGVLVANAGGTVFLGALVAYSLHAPTRRAELGRLFGAAGICGSLTTASTLGLALATASAGERLVGLVVAVAAGVLAAVLGWWLGTLLRRARNRRLSARRAAAAHHTTLPTRAVENPAGTETEPAGTVTEETSR